MDLPIDTTTLSFICTQVPEPRVAFGTDQQQRTAAGEPVFQLGVMFIAGDRSTVLRVRTTTEPAGGKHSGPPSARSSHPRSGRVTSGFAK